MDQFYEPALVVATGVAILLLFVGIGYLRSRRAAASPRAQRAALHGWRYEGSDEWTCLVPNRYHWTARLNSVESRPGADDSVPVLLFEAVFTVPTFLRIDTQSPVEAGRLLGGGWPQDRFPKLRLRVDDHRLRLEIPGDTFGDDCQAEQFLLLGEHLVKNAVRSGQTAAGG